MSATAYTIYVFKSVVAHKKVYLRRLDRPIEEVGKVTDLRCVAYAVGLFDDFHIKMEDFQDIHL